MKKTGLFLISVFMITCLLSFQQAAAQEKSKEDQEKEIKIQQAIDVQKKVMVEQKKAQEGALENLQKTQDELNSIKDLDVQIVMEDSDRVNVNDGMKHMKRISRTFRFNEPYVFTPEGDAFYGHPFEGDNESTTWEFARSVKEKSLKSEYVLDVEKTSNTVVMSVNGDCKAGEIRIKIVTPGGKTYSDIVIDEFGNLNWRKSFTISETENQDKAGAWKFQISSNKATGYFKISLQSY